MPDIAYLILENGKVFKGAFFGASNNVIGEIVFTTGMAGYLETLTDKSYYGQIVAQTFPLIGNYGVIPPDFESGAGPTAVYPKGYIVKSWCEQPSNFRSEENLDTFLKSQNITGIYGLDTRELTKAIRDYGVMNGIITDSVDNTDFESLKSYKVQNAVASVSTKSVYVHENPKALYKVAIVDFGLMQSTKNWLFNHNCEIHVFPHNSSVEDILKINPNGIILSNGPGCPSANIGIIAMVKELLTHRTPIFGIGLGHQLLALANGFEIEKLKFGHRGANQPVKDLLTGQVYITNQNHGYSVISQSINPNIASELFINVNDKTCEGIKYKNFPAFSTQFYPETSDTSNTVSLFEEFIKLL